MMDSINHAVVTVSNSLVLIKIGNRTLSRNFIQCKVVYRPESVNSDYTRNPGLFLFSCNCKYPHFSGTTGLSVNKRHRVFYESTFKENSCKQLRLQEN